MTTEGVKSKPFTMSVGRRQGCALSYHSSQSTSVIPSQGCKKRWS